MAVKIIKCPWCEGEARITYEENRVYQMKCYSCHNTMLHVDHSFDSAVEFFAHQANLLQAEKAGRLVVLPCQVGDTIWRIKCFADWPDIGKPYVEADAFLYRDIHYFGKTVFLTREEAEAVLAGKGGAE